MSVGIWGVVESFPANVAEVAVAGAACHVVAARVLDRRLLAIRAQARRHRAPLRIAATTTYVHVVSKSHLVASLTPRLRQREIRMCTSVRSSNRW